MNKFEQALENYIKSGDFSCILEEYKKSNTLSDSSRRSLVRESTNFLRQHCGNHPKRGEKIALAESIICIFPAFKIANSKFGGIDLFYNPENNSGYLAAKLKTINTKLTKLDSGGKKKRKLSEVDKESDDEAVISVEDLHFFQNCIVADELQLVQQKLQETLKARQKFIATESNVLEHFPIFLYDSSLIDFDFNLRNGEAISNSLLENWEKYESCVEKILIDAAGGPSLGNCTDWATEVLPYLMLLKLLPSTASGRAQKKVNFQKSVDSFLSFENVIYYKMFILNQHK
ncbi:PREDICTED: uncharacterized protein LOC108372200 [Rhagoletis zephyria]|uniref:uncharacterized protein LOC108372200 n=1 Tax=Rhagoletis zephyria TaxID=28612 RepID=UPI000811344D|nr:PREDICTED: uncharacterized protein LOC108372200 [Rhagoletis zephyria]